MAQTPMCRGSTEGRYHGTNYQYDPASPLNKGINTGIRAASNRGNRNREQTQQDSDLERQGKQTSRGLHQTSRLMRRFTKF
jgi:hypothetical protein